MLVTMASCSEEDDLVPVPDTLTDSFAPAPDATDEVSVLRRSFKEEEGSYLLFNDTLRHEFIGKDTNGDDRYFTETLDISYSTGQSTSTQKYSYEYITDFSEMQKSVDFLKQKILTHLPKQLRPFSWFMVKGITNTSDYTTPLTVSGQRSIAVAVGALTDEELEPLTTEVLTTALGKGLESKEKDLESFYAYGEGMYDQSFDGSTENPDGDADINMMLLNKKGFIVQGEFWGFPVQNRYPTKTKDMNSFIELVMNNTDEQVAQKYADYPLVIEKAKLLRSIITNIGYIF